MDVLLRKAQAGDQGALDEFFARELPSLRRWAQQRVPTWLHRRADPDDIVQAAAIKTLRRLCHLDPERASVRPYMRQAVLNLVRDEVRNAGRSPDAIVLEDGDAFEPASPADRIFGADALKAYRRALKTLSPAAQACVVARVERGWSYERIARELGKPSTGAARVAVNRALDRLAAEMRVSGSRSGRPAPRTSVRLRRSAASARRPRR